MEIILGKTLVELLPGRAVFLRESRTLIVADLHLGKSATFRKRGLPVPEGTTESDLGKLTKLLEKHQATRLVIAGDLVHSLDGLTKPVVENFTKWAESIALPIILTEGNHDSRARINRFKLPLKIVPSLTIDEIQITHDPADLLDDQPGIAGHLHPGVRIKETGRRSLRIAGFFLRQKKHLILPAFSEFTGIQPMKLEKNDRFFAETGETISEIPRSLVR